jgi:hypothetical protein
LGFIRREKDPLTNKAEEVSRALTFSRKQKEFDQLNRYQTRLNREATQDLKELEQLQSAREAQSKVYELSYNDIPKAAKFSIRENPR